VALDVYSTGRQIVDQMLQFSVLQRWRGCECRGLEAPHSVNVEVDGREPADDGFPEHVHGVLGFGRVLTLSQLRPLLGCDVAEHVDDEAGLVSEEEVKLLADLAAVLTHYGALEE
jgi:hypothetical protein